MLMYTEKTIKSYQSLFVKFKKSLKYFYSIDIVWT